VWGLFWATVSNIEATILAISVIESEDKLVVSTSSCFNSSLTSSFLGSG
jgi:hypothetical protein